MELPPFIEWKKMENGEMAMREARPDLLRENYGFFISAGIQSELSSV